MWTLAQAALDPGAYQQYGIAGLLGIAFALSLALLRTMILKHAAQVESQQKTSLDQMDKQWSTLLEFTNRHRGELVEAMDTLGKMVASSSDKMSTAIVSSHSDVARELARQSRSFEEAMLSASIMARVREAKANGTAITQEEADRITKAATNERRDYKGG